MTIRDELEHLSLRLGRRVVLPTPPACQELMNQAKASGIPLGTLFVLSHPLAPEIRGSYDRESGDLWCHYDGTDEDGAHDVLQCLLTLIAYAKLRLPVPTTIQEDWEQAERAHREAYALAQDWNRPDLFSAAELESLLAYDQSLLRCHLAAGELAGHLAPSVARNAYLALLEVQRRNQWNDAQFEAALAGISDADEANAAVLDFDRTILRPRWQRSRLYKGNAPHRLSGTSVLPQTPGTAEVLREALREAASQSKEQTRQRRLWPVSKQVSLSFFLIESVQALSSLIAQVNRCLIEEHPLHYARVWWCRYADAEPEPRRSALHLYQCHIEYVSGHPEGTERLEPLHHELWALFPVRSRRECLEAAWQHYLHSWSALELVPGAALSRGLHALWSWLEGGISSDDD
jgi:hypothetical protein